LDSVSYSCLVYCLFCFVFPHILLAFFVFTAPSPTEIYTLSLHDALPIFVCAVWIGFGMCDSALTLIPPTGFPAHFTVGSLYSSIDRKSTRLNSSHVKISYAVFCLKKKILKQEESTFIGSYR